jgi:disulfide bond formation protein DsbB
MTASFLRVDRSSGGIALGTGLGALALLLGALGFQYLIGVAPCEMCHWQRWPHIAAALTGLLLLPLVRKGKAMAALVVTALAVAAGLALAWNWGMLTGWQPRLLAALIIALLGYGVMTKNLRTLAIMAALLVAVSGLIGLYQTGMLLHLLPGPSACTSHLYVIGQPYVPQPRCDEVNPKSVVLGLSLPNYNAIFSGLVALSAGLALWRARK